MGLGPSSHERHWGLGVLQLLVRAYFPNLPTHLLPHDVRISEGGGDGGGGGSEEAGSGGNCLKANIHFHMLLLHPASAIISFY